MHTILVLDDDPIDSAQLVDDLAAEGCKVLKASPFSAINAIQAVEQIDAVILDPGRSETSALSLIGDLSPVPVFILAQHASLKTAVSFLKAGAQDYWAKPTSAAEILKAINFSHTSDNQKPANASAAEAFVGRSPGMRTLMNRANRAAKANSTVLVMGETGTGKELVARHIHQSSARANKPLISVNCAAIPETLIESELFGYEKGAFTGASGRRLGLVEAANGGSLFLDEIGELPASAQARLLRFIQEGEVRRIGSTSSTRVDVRLICATHRDLDELENTDAFRRDLFHRINVLRLEVPPLRDRLDDLRGLTNWLMTRVAERLQLPAMELAEDAYLALEGYDWPGNVRELEHTIERALVMADDVIQPNDLDLPAKKASEPVQLKAVTRSDSDDIPSGLDQTANDELSLEDYFQRFVLENQHAMNETELAQKLGISRKCLWERRQRFDLPRSRKKSQKQA